MNYEIKGGSLPYVIINLNKGETLHTEKGAMSWMSDSLEMSTNAGGGVGKMFSRMFSGESIFQNTYTALKDDQYISLASSFPGQILAIDVLNRPIIAQKRAFLARENSVDMSIFFQRKIGAGFFGGEGFIMQKFEGSGYVFLEIDGSLVEYDLRANESIILDTGHLAAMESSVNMEIITNKGVKNVLFGGEGLFSTKVTGPGRVWIQSMPIYKLMSYFPIDNSSNH